MTFRFSLEFGWMAEPIEAQLEYMGIQTEGKIQDLLPKWQKVADAVLVVKLNGYLRDAEAARIRNKLTRDIEKFLAKEEYIAEVPT